MVSAPNGPEMDKMDILFWATFLKVFDSDHTKQSKQIDTFGLPGPPSSPSLVFTGKSIGFTENISTAGSCSRKIGGQAYRNHKNIRSRWD